MSYYFKQGKGPYSYQLDNAGRYIQKLHSEIRLERLKDDGENLVVAPDESDKDLSSLQ